MNRDLRCLILRIRRQRWLIAQEDSSVRQHVSRCRRSVDQGWRQARLHNAVLDRRPHPRHRRRGRLSARGRQRRQMADTANAPGVRRCAATAAAPRARAAASAGGTARSGRESGCGTARVAARDHRGDPEAVQSIIGRWNRRDQRGRHTRRRGRDGGNPTTAAAAGTNRDAAHADSGGWRHQTTGENQGCRPDISVDRADRPGPRSGDHRSDHRSGGQECSTRGCFDPFRCSMPRPSRRCGNGNTRRRC